MKPVDKNTLEAACLKALKDAETALEKSYCPHSGLCVGAALMLEDGSTLTGINYESDSYGLTLCAERTALARAQAEGRINAVSGIVITAKWRDSAKPGMPLTPCGACRQWLAELSRRLGRNLTVYSFWQGETKGIQTSSMELLPGAFSFENT